MMGGRHGVWWWEGRNRERGKKKRDTLEDTCKLFTGLKGFILAFNFGAFVGRLRVVLQAEEEIQS
jgi:hypothetical protein